MLSRIAFLILFLTTLSHSVSKADDGSDKPGIAMATAAQKLIEVLPAEQKQKLMYKYDDPERLNWHFIPKDRNGIVLWDLSSDQRKVAEELVKAGLSAAGHAKTLQLRSLEEVLTCLKEAKKTIGATVGIRTSTTSRSSELPEPLDFGAGDLKGITCH